MGGDEGRVAPRLAWQWAQKDGRAQRTDAHARPKPTSKTIIICFRDNKKIIVHCKVLPVEKKLVCFALKTFGYPVFFCPHQCRRL